MITKNSQLLSKWLLFKGQYELFASKMSTNNSTEDLNSTFEKFDYAIQEFIKGQDKKIEEFLRKNRERYEYVNWNLFVCILVMGCVFFI